MDESTEAEIEAAVRAERESCARIADSFRDEYGPEVGKMASRIAEIIRRRDRLEDFKAAARVREQQRSGG